MKMRTVILLVIILMVFGGFFYWKTNYSPAVSVAQREILYWYDPMRPDQHFDQPGKSPFMDMDLVPKYRDELSQSSSHQQEMAHSRFRQTHSVKIGKVLLNAHGLPTLPNEAILATGKRYFVIRAEGDGYFSPQAVTVDDMGVDPVVITQGIVAGDSVALTPLFLMDADANIDDFFARMELAGDHHD